MDTRNSYQKPNLQAMQYVKQAKINKFAEFENKRLFYLAVDLASYFSFKIYVLNLCLFFIFFALYHLGKDDLQRSNSTFLQLFPKHIPNRPNKKVMYFKNCAFLQSFMGTFLYLYTLHGMGYNLLKLPYYHQSSLTILYDITPNKGLVLNIFQHQNSLGNPSKAYMLYAKRKIAQKKKFTSLATASIEAYH